MIKNCRYRTQTDQHKIKECTIHVLNQISVDEPRDLARRMYHLKPIFKIYYCVYFTYCQVKRPRGTLLFALDV